MKQGTKTSTSGDHKIANWAYLFMCPMLLYILTLTGQLPPVYSTLGSAVLASTLSAIIGVVYAYKYNKRLHIYMLKIAPLFGRLFLCLFMLCYSLYVIDAEQPLTKGGNPTIYNSAITALVALSLLVYFMYDYVFRLYIEVGGLCWSTSYLSGPHGTIDPTDGICLYAIPDAEIESAEQGLRLPATDEYLCFLNRTTQKFVESNGIRGVLYTDIQTKKSIFFQWTITINSDSGSHPWTTAPGIRIPIRCVKK